MIYLYVVIFDNQLYEGYVFAIYCLIFDCTIAVPFIYILFLANSSTKVWSILTILPQHFIIFLGFKLASISGIVISLFSLIYFFVNFKRLQGTL